MNLKKELEKMNISDLRFICRELDIPCPKTKSGIIKKLLEPLSRKYGMEWVKCVGDYCKNKYKEYFNPEELLSKKNEIFEEMKGISRGINPLYDDVSDLENGMNILRNLGYQVIYQDHDDRFSDNEKKMLDSFIELITKTKENTRQEEDYLKYINKRRDFFQNIRQEIEYINQEILAAKTFPNQTDKVCKKIYNSIERLNGLLSQSIGNQQLYNKIEFLINSYKNELQQYECYYY